MKILLCAATEMEIAPTIHFLTTNQQYSIDLLITGVGLAASTYAITKAVTDIKPSIIIQGGIAGCLDQNLALSSVVVVKNETIGDQGVYENGGFQSLFDMHFLNQDVLPYKNGKLCNNHPVINQTGLPVVDGVTVNEISTNKDRTDYYRNHLKAQVETMEGAALHYVCLMEKTSFLQVRALSNFAGERDKSNWMLEKSIVNLNHEIQRILSII